MLTPTPAESSAPNADDNTSLSVQQDLLEYFEQRSDAPATINFIIDRVTRTYLATLSPENRPHPDVLEQELLSMTKDVIAAENLKRPKTEARASAMSMPKKLSDWQVAQILLKLHHIKRIAPTIGNTDREYDLLAIYTDTGIERGLYNHSEDDMRGVARLYNTLITVADFKEITAILREDAPRVHRTAHKDITAVRNGVFFYGTKPLDVTINGHEFHFEPKQVHPFSPDLIFMNKAQVDYVEDAPMQIISHPTDGDWEVGQWLEALFDAPGQEGLSDLIWEIIGAILRPNVAWGKTAWFYSEKGNNGKGTLCELMRNLVGAGTYAAIPLSDFGKEFALEPLIRANAIIVDENDVGTLIDKAANMKAVVTGDVIAINRKHRVPIAFQFFGFMVQCLNEFPRAKDKSESFYRRQLFVPFTKSFTGAERKYIKNDYFQRREVLEYVLWYAFNKAGAATPGSYYQLSEPMATALALEEYKEVNDPVRSFWEETREMFVWDLLPFSFLYDLFKTWFAQVSPSGSMIARQRFVSSLVAIIEDDELWGCPDKNRKIRPAMMMDQPEPLIAQYKLDGWYCPTYKGTDSLRLSRPRVMANYRGILRRTLPSTAAAVAMAQAS